MTTPTGEAQDDLLRPDFDRRVMLQVRGSVVTSDAGLLAYRELDDALGLTPAAGDLLADVRTGKNGRHALVGMFRQSVFGRLAGYEDVNDAVRLRHDPAMRWIIGGKATKGSGASPSQNGFLQLTHRHAFDPPPFSELYGIVSLTALFMAVLILTAENRLSQIEVRRNKLDLQINLLTERKVAKLIVFSAHSRRGAHVAVAIGGDRKAAILCMISANNCRGIATSAIWNVT